MKILLGALLLLFTWTAEAQDSFRLNNGVNNYYFWRHNICGKISNASGKDIMIPLKTAPEFSSFMTATNAGVTKFACDPVLDTFDWPNVSGDLCNLSTTITFSGINISFEVALEGLEVDEGPDSTLGGLSYSLNGGAFIDASANQDLISYPIQQDTYDDITISNGDTMQLRYCATGGGLGTMSVTLYNTFTSQILDTLSMHSSTP